MQTGVSTASLFLRKNTEDALPLLEVLGVKTAEVFLTSFSEYGYPFADILKERKGNLHINSVHDLNTGFEPQLFAAHPRVRADAFGWMEKVLQSANALGAPYYTFHGTARVKRATRQPNADNFPKMIEGFARILDVCRIHGIDLCLENVEWATYNRPSVFATLAKELPTLRGVLDIKQARISGYPYEEYLTEMGERLAYAHVSDINDMGKMCLPGQGKFDFDTMVKRLKDVGFDGALLIEVYEDNYADPIELKQSCAYLDEILYKNNALTR